MQYEFLKNFPRRMKNVGLYAVIVQNSVQKLSWKQYGFTKFDEQINLLFIVLLYIMEQSLKEEKCTMDDIATYIDTINVQYMQKDISYEQCRKLGDFIVNTVLSNEGRPIYFDGYHFEKNAYEKMQISYVANKIVYIENEVRRTSYYLTDDGYNLLLSTLEIEDNMKFNIHEIIFRLHLEKQSYDKAVDDIKNVFNLMRIQFQKVQEAMRQIRRNALNYSVKDYEEILLGNLNTITDTKKKFQSYREMIQMRVEDLEEENINIRKLDKKEKQDLNNLKIIEKYLTRVLDEHQKILNSHFDLKILYTEELERLSQARLIQRFSIRKDFYDKVLQKPASLENMDMFFRPLFNKNPEKIYNLNKAFSYEKSAGKYKNIKEQLKRRDTIQKFKEEAVKIQAGAEEFLSQEQEREEQEKLIAAFIEELNILCEKAETEQKALIQEKEKQEQELELIKYEELSCEYHEKNREKSNHVSNREMIDLEKESLCRKREKIQKKVNIFCCAKQQEMVDEDRQEWEIRKEKAAIVREREEDLEPERNRIGGLLCDYYRKQIEDNKERQIKISNQKIQIQDDVAQEKDRLENYREEIKKIIEQKGGLRSLVRNYDNTEIKYNTRYKENLSRNILGIYEPGMLEIKQETYEQEVKKSLQENKKKKEKLQNTNEEIYKKERMLEEKKEQYIQKNVEIEQTIEEKNSYEQEIEERKDILKYLELPQEKLFAREEILHKAWGKIEELEDRKRKLEKKEDIIRKEHKLLASGRVMELSENLREEFEKFDIPVIYGMEWLKKNGFGEEKNKRIFLMNKKCRR